MSMVPSTQTSALAAMEGFTATGNQWIDLVGPAAQLAAMIATTEFVPAEMRNKPAAVTACILYGAEIGIGPMQSLAKVDIVKGRPAPRAELARALALAAGHELWVEESTNTRVSVCGRRRNSDHVQKVTWTLDDVKKAGISNANYQKFPRQMLLARASAELVRAMCPDVLGGIGLFAEEADEVDNGPNITAPPAEPVKATTRRRAAAPEPAALPAAGEPTEANDAPADDTTADLATEMQIKRLIVGFNAASITKRDDRIAVIVAIIGRPVESSKECTRDEASKVIDTLERIADGSMELQYIDGEITVAAAQSDLPPLPFEESE